MDDSARERASLSRCVRNISGKWIGRTALTMVLFDRSRVLSEKASLHIQNNHIIHDLSVTHIVNILKSSLHNRLRDGT